MLLKKHRNILMGDITSSTRAVGAFVFGYFRFHNNSLNRTQHRHTGTLSLTLASICRHGRPPYCFGHVHVFDVKWPLYLKTGFLLVRFGCCCPCPRTCPCTPSSSSLSFVTAVVAMLVRIASMASILLTSLSIKRHVA